MRYVAALLLLLSGCENIVVESEPLKEQVFIISCRSSAPEMCEETLKKSCQNASRIEREDKDGRLTLTAICPREE